MSDFQELIVRRLEARIAVNAMSAAAIRIERRGEILLDWAGERRDFTSSSSPATTDSVFHIASISKPMTTSTVSKLIEQGLIDADDYVVDFVPEFAAHGKENVKLRHCFTHTSGLPDMVPGNIPLRERNAPLSEFVAATCSARLLFQPGTDVRYQSSGILMLGEIAERVTGKPFRDYMAETLFEPTGMTSSHLGWKKEFELIDIASKEKDPENTSHWDHNSLYWRDFGGPWAGVHSTAADITRLMQMMLAKGQSQAGDTVLEPGTVNMILQDHISALPDLTDEARLREGWGFGWRIQRLGDGGLVWVSSSSRRFRTRRWRWHCRVGRSRVWSCIRSFDQWSVRR
ncbi:MAG: serine hydrolase [Chloroflexi bacterium]|nr:serine hydrolase [Chloroflexota bacterium]